MPCCDFATTSAKDAGRVANTTKRRKHNTFLRTNSATLFAGYVVCVCHVCLVSSIHLPLDPTRGGDDKQRCERTRRTHNVTQQMVRTIYIHCVVNKAPPHRQRGRSAQASGPGRRHSSLSILLGCSDVHCVPGRAATCKLS